MPPPQYIPSKGWARPGAPAAPVPGGVGVPLLSAHRIPGIPAGLSGGGEPGGRMLGPLKSRVWVPLALAGLLRGWPCWLSSLRRSQDSLHPVHISAVSPRWLSFRALLCSSFPSISFPSIFSAFFSLPWLNAGELRQVSRVLFRPFLLWATFCVSWV